MREMKNDDYFNVGDLITLKHHRGDRAAPPPLALVMDIASLAILDRIMIQFFDTSGPEMAAPEHWIVVSHAK